MIFGPNPVIFFLGKHFQGFRHSATNIYEIHGGFHQMWVWVHWVGSDEKNTTATNLLHFFGSFYQPNDIGYFWILMRLLKQKISWIIP